MLITRSVHPRWLSNSWLVAESAGAPAIVVDAGGPAEPLLAFATDHALRIELVLLTHHHADHVAERAAFAAPCAMHPLDAEHVEGVSRLLHDGERVEVGGMQLTMLHVPGHTRGQINAVLQARDASPVIFTGDTLFRGSVGGTRVPGHGTFEQLRASILERLLTLPHATRVLPGHGETTTLGDESATNPFVRAWRSEDAVLDEPCKALGEPATLLTWARDHDGGFKAWVRWSDGSLDVVPGSRVERSAR